MHGKYNKELSAKATIVVVSLLTLLLLQLGSSAVWGKKGRVWKRGEGRRGMREGQRGGTEKSGRREGGRGRKGRMGEKARERERNDKTAQLSCL